jgi:hypothetical protein
MNIDDHLVDGYSNEQAETRQKSKHLGSYFTMDGDHVSAKLFMGVLLNVMNEERRECVFLCKPIQVMAAQAFGMRDE